ncbi:MAG TPA: pyridoxamine 5'-phosphate oxidase [Solirubrobacteraceae bacterium]|nr:pyridoxamine 5'-phosphate oxidase [Solirubrobacteraceae bacterium]
MADHDQPLNESAVDPDPVVQFHRWFDAAADAGIRMPEAMAVASATADGAPSVRMVLMKGCDERGIVFFTNYGSRKGAELDANQRAALLFHWDALGRQVRIEGPVTRTSDEESADYARSRPRASRLSALASPQSRPIADRAELERRVAALERELADVEPPVDPEWGGFRVIPRRWEFWQNRDDRLHDRLVYLPLDAGGWRIQRLAP